jgi:hypothetical protein
LQGTVATQNLGALDSEKLHVFKNNYLYSTYDHILGIFPVVQRFVGEDFFKSVAKDFASECPPQEPVMHKYGENFSDFLRVHEALSEMQYIADLAQVEWNIHALQFMAAPEISGLNPVMAVVNSDYPLIRLWMVGQGQLPPESVHIDEGGDTLAIVRVNDEILIQPLSHDEFDSVGQLLNGLSFQKIERSVASSLQTKGVILQGEGL